MKVGRLRAPAPHVAKILVDGVEIRDVFELDDREGWVWHYVRKHGQLQEATDEQGNPVGKFEAECIEGVVKVVLR